MNHKLSSNSYSCNRRLPTGAEEQLGWSGLAAQREAPISWHSKRKKSPLFFFFLVEPVSIGTEVQALNVSRHMC